ncbi:Tubulin polyglutamylase ttll6 [Quaeritorhiza haematococci]|nr:Tubulin polyglutamylase ttll6 [Quaeritorhiza haematococci]
MHDICRKDRLGRNLNRFNKLFPKDYNFFPRTWNLPWDWADLKLAAKSNKKTVFIAKPGHGSQGKGIFLFKNLKDIPKIHQSIQPPIMIKRRDSVNEITAATSTPSPRDSTSTISSTNGAGNNKQGFNEVRKSAIVQKYLAKPLLIDGFKFDLRVYVLVTSVDPLRVFIYKDGLARFATEPYEPPDKSNLSDVCMHLTNYAINKKSDKFKRDESGLRGSKRRITAVLEGLRKKRGCDVDRLWKRIGDVIIKTLITVQPQLSRNLNACSRNAMDKCSNSNVTSTNSTKHGSAKGNEGAGVRDGVAGGTSGFGGKDMGVGGEGGVGKTTTSADEDIVKNLLMTYFGAPCFEILGFDIFVDSKLKPWVLEVNHSPSFTCDSELDYEIKHGVITDALRLLNLNSSTRKKFQKQQKEKLKSRLWGSNGSFSSLESGLGRRVGYSDVKGSVEVQMGEYSGSRTVASPVQSIGTALDPTPVKEIHSNTGATSSIGSLSVTSSVSTIVVDELPKLPSSEDISEEGLTQSGREEARDSTAEPGEDIRSDSGRDAYEMRYPQAFLNSLQKFEDENMGQFQRIFPPEDPVALTHYLELMKRASMLHEETKSTKQRKEFLQKKKQEEERKSQQLQEWKKKVAKMRSSGTSRVAQMLAAGKQQGPEAISRSGSPLLAPDDEFGDEDGVYASRDFDGIARITRATASAPQSASSGRRRPNSSQQDRTIKLHVESLNERFDQHIFAQEIERKMAYEKRMEMLRELRQGNGDGRSSINRKAAGRPRPSLTQRTKSQPPSSANTGRRTLEKPEISFMSVAMGIRISPEREEAAFNGLNRVQKEILGRSFRSLNTLNASLPPSAVAAGRTIRLK